MLLSVREWLKFILYTLSLAAAAHQPLPCKAGDRQSLTLGLVGARSTRRHMHCVAIVSTGGSACQLPLCVYSQ